MMKKFTFLLLLFISLGVMNQVYGQARGKKANYKQRQIATFKGHKKAFNKNKKYNAVGVSLNSLNYFGDLSPSAKWGSTDLLSTRYGIGFFGIKRLGPFFSLRGSFLYGRISGGDYTADPFHESGKFRYVRNLHFRNDIKELNISGVFDLNPNFGSYMTRVRFTPFAAIGIALFHHNPQAMAPDINPYSSDGSPFPESGKWVDLKPLGTEGQNSEYDIPNKPTPYSNYQIAIPVSIGIRYRLNQYMDFSFEVGYRHTFTDYLDDASGDWVDAGALGSDLARAMADRSREVTNPLTGQERHMEDVVYPLTGNRVIEQPSEYNGETYPFYGGYGHEGATMRGNRRNNDIYFVTSFQLTYIIGGSFKNAKFR